MGTRIQKGDLPGGGVNPAVGKLLLRCFAEKKSV